MSNLPPDWREEREHRIDCASLCEYEERDGGNDDADQCPWGHTSHECNCDELHGRDIAAYAEYLYDHTP